jgi:hypothetical protein
MDGWVWSNGGKTDSGNWSAGRITCPSASLSTTKLTHTALGSSTGLCDRIPTVTSNRPRHSLHATCPTHVVTDQINIPTPGSVIFIDPAVLQMLPRIFLFVRRQGCDHTNMATPDRCHYSLLMSGGRGERGKWSSPSSHDAIGPSPSPSKPLMHNRLLAAVGSWRGTQTRGRTNGRVEPHRAASDGRHVDRRQVDTGGGAVADRRGVGVRWVARHAKSSGYFTLLGYRSFWHQSCPQHHHWNTACNSSVKNGRHRSVYV